MPPPGSQLRVVTLLDVARPSGGAERLAMELMTRLDPERFDRTLCASRTPLPQEREEAAAVLAPVREAGVRVLQLDRSGTVDLASWRPLWSHLRREGVDILHAHMFGSNAWGTVIGRMAGVPVVVAHEHTWSFQGERLRRFLDRELIGRYADAFLAVSRADRRKMIEVEGIDPDKVIFLPNGIAPPAKPTGRDVRAELGIDRDAPLLVAVGVLRPQKALHVLIRAASMLVDEFPDLRVLLVGEGEERGRLEGLALELGLEDTVLLAGLRIDIPDVLEALDVAVSSSDFEGSPLAILEYMEAAKPVVATRVGGVPDLIEDGVHGLLVEPGDPQALAHAVARVLRDPDYAARLGTQARERRRAEFDIEVMVRRVERLYEDLYRAKQARNRRYRPLPAPGKHVRPVCQG